MSSWSAPVAAGPVEATVEVPGSKSITNRALVLAALAQGPSRLTGVLRSRDTDLMIAALAALGTGITGTGAADAPVSVPAGPLAPQATALSVQPGVLIPATVDCGLAGTVMRFLPAVAALAAGDSLFDGDAAARVRPQSTVLDALRALGVAITGDRLPFTVHGTGAVRGGEVEIDASGSSQFVSGLLLAAARFDQGVTVRHVGSAPVPSGPHITMTIEMLRAAGVEVEILGASGWRVAPGPIRAVDTVIEPDLSNATPFLAAAAVTGGVVRIPHWPRATTQPGDAFRGILERMGARVELEPAPFPDGTADSAGAAGGRANPADPSGTATLRVTGPERLRGVDLDLSEVGELTPTVAALCALADGPSVLRGIAHLRGHETDRLAALCADLDACGATVRETADGLAIDSPATHGAPWRAHADHRMATAGAILGLRLPGLEVDDIDSTSKTLPGFAGMWSAMPGVRTGGH